MIRINGIEDASLINEILEKDFTMFDSVISCKFSPLVRTIMGTELNPNYEVMYNFCNRRNCILYTRF